MRWHEFSEIWAVDFEFGSSVGENPQPICLVAYELLSERCLRFWQDDLGHLASPPYSLDKSTLFLSYYASAELGCHLSLGWPLPPHVLDLYVEFRNLTNGQSPLCGAGLLGALAYVGLPCVTVNEKDAMRALAIRGGPWTTAERTALLDYCESDVQALGSLFHKIAPMVDLPRALFRGRYMKAVAQIEAVGIPIDVKSLSLLRKHWTEIQDHLIARVDSAYGVYEGQSFRRARFERWLFENQIQWPRLASGELALDDNTFRDMARRHPVLEPLRQLRGSLAQLRLSDLSVGTDGRNRCLLSTFRSKTGRNQPRTSEYIFGQAAWVRGLIRPRKGFGLAYVDWCQQEFGIAAYLSDDLAMIEAYESRDPYLAFAIQAGAAPKNATKVSHASVREQFKACALAVLYGMGAEALAARIGQPKAYAGYLLRLHRQSFPQFWVWSDAAVQYALMKGQIQTVFGWNLHVGALPNPRSIRNFPMQANGAEMLRLACCLATEQGIRVCGPIHDALLIEAPLNQLDAIVAATEETMAQASDIVLGGPRLRTEAKIVRYPDRYTDGRGTFMWNTVWDVLNRITGRDSSDDNHDVA
jgi:hypothetical protein